MNVYIATVSDKNAILNAEESWHCCKVMRNKAGDEVRLIDGNGNFYTGILEFISEKQCRASVQEGPVKQPKRDYNLHLAIAPTKSMDRMEWLLEKVVEIGVDEISFLKCKNSERGQVKLDRVKKIVETAVKQSLQARIPVVNDLVTFSEMCHQQKDKQKLIAHCYPSEKQDIRQIRFKNTSTLFLIGPEGDFSKEEVALSKEHGFTEVSLGSNRLRTETAGLFVCQAAQLL